MIAEKTHKITIGSAQFGLDYGIASSGSPVSEQEVTAILKFAREHNILTIDTAAAYGNAEEVLGHTVHSDAGFQIITKISSVHNKNKYIDIQTQIGAELNASLTRLNTKSVYGFMLHDTAGLAGDAGDELIAALRELQQAGLVEKIGISLYEAFEIEDVFGRFDLDMVQIPVNVFDQRLLDGVLLSDLKQRGVEIHARSVFLQGLLLMHEDEIPDHLEPARMLIREFRKDLSREGITPLAVALGFVRQLEFIDHMVIGFQSLAHLQECVTAFDTACQIGFSRFSCDNPAIIDPRLWGKS